MKKIIISVQDISLSAELNDSAAAQKIWEELPVEGEADIWGDEIYFEIPIDMNEEADARTELEAGDLAYWPVGSAFCIFFGPTPVSTDDKKPRAASPVNVFGRVTGDISSLRKVRSGIKVRVERA
ncbi:MAG: hypothetical protein BWK80_04150 [Desulfobacteraceae bacterium IS3]|nr:MAG: hypothetical protein BWK80_04150 [Desulfobacteraceae bacterium IS3]